MNKEHLIVRKWALLLIYFAFLAVSSCSDTAKDTYMPDHKNYPNEHFFLQRAYPDNFPDLKAMEAGMNEALNSAALRSLTFNQKWTTEGPGNIGARANAVAVHPTNENIIYIGFSNGGLWKTTDGGKNWTSIFDENNWISIGDIEIDPKNPETFYVATGDPNISFYPMLGDGLYRSTNGGATFTRIGLKEHRVLSRVMLHPTNPNIIFAASMGLPFVRSKDRGLYRSMDGGKTWKQVLFVSDQAGITDMEMDPFDPNVMYAAGWDRVRSNKESVITGPGSRIFKSLDGGSTWSMIQNGLPQQDLGRIALAISKTTPGVLYARYVGTNSQLQVIFKTTDAGNTWQLIPINGLSNSLGGFGWYFGNIELNPKDDNELYLLGVSLHRRNPTDGTWSIINGQDVHVDMHDLQFTNAGNMYLATDGGVYKSTNQARTWLDIENIPTTQFYRLAFNPHKPQLYYGGAQDNGTVSGNAATLNSWRRIFGGDGFQALFHPNDSSVFFVETQNGGISVTTNGGTSFKDATKGIDAADRRNWDMPYLMSSFNTKVMYTGTFRVYKSTSGTDVNYVPISQDLTDGLVHNARHHNITSLDESPLMQGLLYVGTSDGNVWRTDDDGVNWINISTWLPDRYVTSVKASSYQKDWCYATHSGYRDNEFIPRVHRSKNRGVSWENIASNLPNIAVNHLLVLPNTRDSVMFVATDAGVYVTVNAGASWERLGSNMPFVPAFHLVVNPVTRTLAVATFARSVMTYPIDDIFKGPLTSVNVLYNKPMDIKISPNPANKMVNISWSQVTSESVSLSVHDTNGRIVKVFPKIDTQGFYALDVESLKSGLYFISLRLGQKTITQRLVKN